MNDEATPQVPRNCLPDSLTDCNNTVIINTEESFVVEVQNFTADQTELFNLLNSWDLTDLFTYLDGEGVYMKDLKILATLNPEHISNLLKPFKWNVIIKFSDQLKQWYNTLSTTDGAIPNSDSACYKAIASSSSTCTSPMSPFSMASDSSDNVNIIDILNDTQEGKALLKEMNCKMTAMETLSDLLRDTLCNVLVSYYIRSGLKMSTKICQQLSEEIVLLLPTEEKDYYYLPRKNASPLGKLHFKYHNQISRIKKTGLYMADSKKPKLKLTVPETTLEVQMDSEQHYQSLRNYVLTLEELMFHWKGCSTERFKYIARNQTKEIFEHWPQYKDITGYKLISLDYFILFKDAGRLLDDVYMSNFYDKILIIMKIKIKDPTSKQILENLITDNSVTLNGRYLTIFTLIHAILKNNPMKEIVNENGTKEKIKCSIKECQNCFILCCSTIEQLDAHFENISRGAAQIQPFIATVGRSCIYPEQIFVYLDGIKYKLNSTLQAIDICFKTFQVFNMKYPIAGQIVWEFIQVYFYKEVPLDITHPSIKNLLKELV